jgi:hypothetical protein
MMGNPQLLAVSPVSLGGIEHHIMRADPALILVLHATKFVIGEQN